MLLGLWVYTSEHIRQQDVQAHQQRLAHSFADRLSASIHNSTLLLYGLGELALQKSGHIPELAVLVSRMRASNPNILNIAILPEGVVRQIEPLAGNEEALGHDMFRDPARIADARLAQESGELTVTGPYRLIQGNQGVIARLPLQQNGQFWGFVSIVYEFPQLIAAMATEDMRDEDVLFQLRNDVAAPAIIGNADSLPEGYARVWVPLPNNEWFLRLAFAPAINWILLLKLALMAAVLPVTYVIYKSLLLSFTQKQRLKLALERNNQLTERQARQQKLLAQVSHDLRTPLQYLLNEVRNFARTDNARVTPANTIEQSVRYQLNLIDQLLAYSASDSRELASDPEPGYTYRFLSDICNQARFLAESRDNHFVAEITADLPEVIQADFRQLQQVLLNLLSNAAKFTHQGAVCLRVELVPACTANRHRLRFCVRDTGPGMPVPEERGRHPNSGHGLGLMIVADLLRLMDSQLEYQSAPEGGAEFCFELELPYPELMPDPYVESHLQDWDAEGLSLLLLDPDGHTRDSLGELLMGYGADVYSCGTLASARQQLGAGCIDLIITELTLPDGSAENLLAEGQARSAPIPVLLYSARPAQPCSEPASESRFSAELLKPATSDQLLGCIQRLVRATITQR